MFNYNPTAPSDMGGSQFNLPNAASTATNNTLLTETSHQLRVLSHNCQLSKITINHLLETSRSKFDFLLLQETCYSLIRHTTSLHSKQGDPITSLPIHPSWTLIEQKHNKKSGPYPGVCIYANKACSFLNPKLLSHYSSHLDLMFISIALKNNKQFIIGNVYNRPAPHGDACRTLLSQPSLLNEVDILMGDFNLHHDMWDLILKTRSPTDDASELTQLMSDKDLILLNHTEHPDSFPTQIPQQDGILPSVLDLIFLKKKWTTCPHSFKIDINNRLRLDHALVSTTINIGQPEFTPTNRKSLLKDDNDWYEYLDSIDNDFTTVLTSLTENLFATPLETVTSQLTQRIISSFNTHAMTTDERLKKKAAENNGKRPKTTHGWWNDDCATFRNIYLTTRDLPDYKNFISEIKKAKRSFFEERIKTIAVTNTRPWDLMNWTGPSHCTTT